jgi:hypothetical protein
MLYNEIFLKKKKRRRKKKGELAAKKKKEQALREKRRIDELSQEATEAELQELDNEKTARKNTRMEKLAAQVEALEPGRAGAGRVIKPTAASVASSQSNFR